MATTKETTVLKWKVASGATGRLIYWEYPDMEPSWTAEAEKHGSPGGHKQLTAAQAQHIWDTCPVAGQTEIFRTATITGG